jgi:hypothetical protein
MLAFKKRLGRCSQRRRFVYATPPAFSRRKVIAKISAIFFFHHIRLGLAALIVGFGIIELTVFTNMDVGAALWALVSTPNNAHHRNLFIAVKTM